jgi:hypothetical protein
LASTCSNKVQFIYSITPVDAESVGGAEGKEKKECLEQVEKFVLIEQNCSSKFMKAAFYNSNWQEGAAAPAQNTRNHIYVQISRLKNSELPVI